MVMEQFCIFTAWCPRIYSGDEMTGNCTQDTNVSFTSYGRCNHWRKLGEGTLLSYFCNFI